MKAIELDAAPLSVADLTNPINVAQDLQLQLATYPEELRPAMAAEAIDILGDPRQIYGGQRLLLHALGAQILATPQLCSEDEVLYHGLYIGEAHLRASFSRFAYIQHRVFKSLCIQLFETDVLASTTDPMFNGQTIRSGVFVPVGAVEMVLAA